MASALGIGVDSLAKLRDDGMPEVTVGGMPRFCAADVLAWDGIARLGTSGCLPPKHKRATSRDRDGHAEASRRVLT
jgi:hypothetical protein